MSDIKNPDDEKSKADEKEGPSGDRGSHPPARPDEDATAGSQASALQTVARAPLTLKSRAVGTTASVVRQSFSHGRSKTVVVETKRRRDGDRPFVETKKPPLPSPLPVNIRPESHSLKSGQTSKAVSSFDVSGLSEGELAARQRALTAARAIEEKQKATGNIGSEPPPIYGNRPENPAFADEKLGQPGSNSSEHQNLDVMSSATGDGSPDPLSRIPVVSQDSGPLSKDASPGTEDEKAVEAKAKNALLDPKLTESKDNVTSQARDLGQTHTSSSFQKPPSNLSSQNLEKKSFEKKSYESPPRRDGYQTSSDIRQKPADFGRDRNARPTTRQDRPGTTDPRSRRGASASDNSVAAGTTVRYSAVAPRGGRPSSVVVRNDISTSPEISKVVRTSFRAADRKASTNTIDDDDDSYSKGSGFKKGDANAKAVSRIKGEPKRREGRLTIQVVSDEDGGNDRVRSLASVRRAREREREKRAKTADGVDAAKVIRDVIIPDMITVQELAQRMATRNVDIIKFMMRQGVMVVLNDVLDGDTAELIATDFGHTVKRVSESDVETGFISEEDLVEDTQPRPPVVTIMGHVDHGKTSLLDALRSTDVTASEHGGITQHIGAYQVTVATGDKITFLDTPGHAAFSAMRARGANLTDIVVLVVAADDGVKPQTIEAIHHAKAANAPLIVAINKMDKPDADPSRVINELLHHEIVVESLGGETQAVEISATKKMGLDRLLEAILLQAEIMDLRANADRSAEGIVIESKLDRGRGPVATVLVKRGALKRGDIVVAGMTWGRVRALVNEKEEQVSSAGPGTPVEILGLDQTPPPGEAFAVVENEARARDLTEYRERLRREKTLSPIAVGSSLVDMMARLQTKKVSELPLIVKADTQGSAEAIVSALEKLNTDEVKARIIHSAAGAITDSDVLLAKGSGCSILGFNVRASRQVRDLATKENVEIRYYAIIYDLLDDIKGVMSGMLAPIQRETFLGQANVLQTFEISKIGRIAGCRVSEGVVRKGARVRIIRDDVVIQDMGVLQTLKRFKDEVAEVQAGQECGMAFHNFQDLRAGDQIECFTVESIQRSL